LDGPWGLALYVSSTPCDTPPVDCDCDVDEDDFDTFQSCASGPAVPYTGDCAAKDFYSDLDVDQDDFAIFQRCFSGENNPADPNCVN